VLAEVRMARIVDAIGRVREKRLSCVEAGELLGLSERHFRRLRDAYLEGGAEAITDQRRGRPASNKAPDRVADWVAEQYRTKYFDFTAKHFHEALKKDGFGYGYSWTKSVLYLRGLLKPAKARGPHRRKRPRSPLPGMLVFQDGSTHDWFLGRRAPCDLIVTLDDATGTILSAFLVEEEGTASSFGGLRETIEKHGLFSSFYTDRGSHYFHTPKAGEKVDKEQPTQVGRSLAQLGIAHIPSYSPEGRGRMERVFGTLQGRLPQELRVAGLDDIECANAWLVSSFVPAFNARFAIKPEEEGTAFLAFVGDLENILCVQQERAVGNDNCVRYEGRVLQIPEQAHRRHYVKAQVRVHAYPDGSLAIFHGPRQLARFPAEGAPKAKGAPASSASARARSPQGQALRAALARRP
jgi:transposase